MNIKYRPQKRNYTFNANIFYTLHSKSFICILVEFSQKSLNQLFFVSAKWVQNASGDDAVISLLSRINIKNTKNQIIGQKNQ